MSKTRKKSTSTSRKPWTKQAHGASGKRPAAKSSPKSPTAKPAASPATHPSASSTAPDRLDYLSVLPGILLCLMLALVLAMDLAFPGMEREQYTNFPALYRMVSFTVTGCGILYWILALRREGLQRLHPRELVRTNSLYVLFFGLLCLWMIASTLVNGLNDYALHGVPYRDLGIFRFLSLFLIYLALPAGIRRDSIGTGFLGAFLAVSDLIALAVLMDRYIHAIPAFAYKKEVSAIFFNGNHYGYFLTMAVLTGTGLVLYHADRRLQIFGGASLLLNFIILLFNHSFGCILAVGITFLLALVMSIIFDRSSARRLGCLLAVFAALGLLSLLISNGLREDFAELFEDVQTISAGGDEAGSAGHNRWLLWTLTLEYIAARPVFGYGCEGISDQLMEATGRANPHNEILTYAAFFGIPAALFYMLGICSIFFAWIRRKLWQDPVASTAALAALGYFLSSLVGVPMFYTIPFFFTFLGLSLRKR